MNTLNFSQLDSVVGDVFVITTSKGVLRIIFGEDEFQRFSSGLNGAELTEGGDAEKSAGEVKLYLEGRLRNFESNLDLSSGTPFQRSVWGELLKVSYGSLTTYREIAEKIGAPGAARAVGNAVGANPVPIIVPCHRVVAANGLGGYSCGIEIKKKLLQLEGAIPISENRFNP